MTTASRLVVALAAAVCVSPPLDDDESLRPQPAVDVILRAFEDHRVVGLSEGSGHGELENLDLLTALIRDPRFPRTVRNIVIEFGNARYQPLLDRYVSGEPVTRDELRRVWEDTTQVTGIWSLPMYEQMLAVARSVNAGLPASLRIRILAGDPPIDWGAVTSPADEDMNDWRDAHAAHVVEHEVLRRGQKALVWIGGAHISRRVIFPNSLIHLLDARFPGQTWVVVALDPGRVDPAIRARLDGWPLPAGASVRGTWLGKVDLPRVGHGLSRAGVVEEDVDALLLLTRAPPRRQDPAPLDPAYAGELARRRALGDATQPFRGGRIRFEENRAAFTTEADAPLQAIVKELLRDRELRLLVKAFADRAETGADSLSSRRAELVVDWLTARGIDRDRLLPTGCGTRRPLTFADTAADRAMNRRAELVRVTPTAACEPPW